MPFSPGRRPGRGRDVAGTWDVARPRRAAGRRGVRASPLACRRGLHLELTAARRYTPLTT